MDKSTKELTNKARGVLDNYDMVAKRIGKQLIGYGHKPLITAEIGLNHNGSQDRCLTMIEEAKKCGADGVKLQYVFADDFANKDNVIRFKQYSRTNDVYDGIELVNCVENEYDYFKRHEITLDIVKKCYVKTRELNMMLGVTTTSAMGVLEVLPYCDYLKVASDMAKSEEMLDEMARFDIPKVIATGHLELNELKNFNQKWLYLHCISEYPANNPKLWKIKHMQEMGLLTGYSDHTIGTDACKEAIKMGALWIEVHFTLDRLLPGADHWFSKDVKELIEICNGI